MSIPDVIEATNIPSQGEEPKGIIHEIRSKVTDENILNFVAVTSNATSFEGSLETLVKWNSAFQGSANKEAYVQLEFKNRYVFPSHYSFKGFSGSFFAKQWRMFGLNSENEAPTVLATNSVKDSSTYCCDSSNCCNDNWGTFEINQTSKGFRYIRINCTESSFSSIAKWRVALRGFEIFGRLQKEASIKKTKRTYCFKSYPVNNHLPTYAFLRMFSVYLS